jgi:hypothetical protein
MESRIRFVACEAVRSEVSVGAARTTSSLVVDLADSPDEKRALHCAWLRELYGPIPFRPLSVDPGCLTPNVIDLAQTAYDERVMPSGEIDPVRLAVLADALEESGGAGELLEHLRGRGPHVRGCFAVDLNLSQK